MRPGRGSSGCRRARAAVLIGSAVIAVLCQATPSILHAATIVECRDTRGVAILSSATGGPACANLPSSPRAAGRNASPTHTTAPADFPRVDGPTQQRRDNDRARILQDELGDEESRLAALQTRERLPAASLAPASGFAPAGQRDVESQLARSRENIRALQRELAGVASR